MTRKKIEEKYKSLSDVEHILLRPGMYVGSTKEEEQDVFVYNRETDKMELKTVTYVPAILKIIDEVISNSVDEYRREDNMGLTSIQVSISPSGHIVVRDNGGIPIVKHKEAGCYIPEFIFGRLRTSSNYDDTEQRNVIGTNGVGVKIANIFSNHFEIYTADGKNSFRRSWTNNMQSLGDDLCIEKCSKHFTETSFDIDFSRFDITTGELSEDFISMIEKRCIDAAAANRGLSITFECDEYNHKSSWKFKNFQQYIDLYSNMLSETSPMHYTNDDYMAEVYVYPDSSLDVAFVNGAECSKGTHIRAVRNDINNAVVDYLTKKDKMDITSRSVDGKYAVFMVMDVVNPSYDSQTKDTLTSPINWTTPEKFLYGIQKSEIIELMRDWYKQKVAADDQKTLRKLNAESKKGLRRPDKYVPANTKILKDRCLYIFEGDSAATGFRNARNPQTQGAYLMRGVPMNALDLTPIQIMKNEVFNDIITILGLQFGKDFDVSKLNYGKIVIATDADVDGDKIAALLLLFFNTYWPQLIENHIICRSLSPIVIAKKGKETKEYYTLDEFRTVQKSLKGYEIQYCKGLGGLNPMSYKKMMREPKYLYFKKDIMADNLFKKWFGKDSDNRKELMSDSLK